LVQFNGALDHAEGIVITGPGNARSGLKAFLDHVRPHATIGVFAVKSLDHPDAEALLALGRQYFPGALSTAAPDNQSHTDE
jgi:hypothetical protein